VSASQAHVAGKHAATTRMARTVAVYWQRGASTLLGAASRQSIRRLASSCAAVPSLCSSINRYQTDRQRKRDVPLILVRPLVSQRRPSIALRVWRSDTEISARNCRHACTAVLLGLLLPLLGILLLTTRLWNGNGSCDTYQQVPDTRHHC